MEENINKQKPTTSEPPAPAITVRTMDSDIKAIEQGGGEMVAPQPFTPSEPKLQEPKVEAGISITGYTGPEKAIFTPSFGIPREQIEPSHTRLSWKKIVAIIIGILIIVAGFGLLGYFIVSSWIFPKQMPAVQ